MWRELDGAFDGGQRILELNCDTGVDAGHLASRGVHVVAYDISGRMVEVARERAHGNNVDDRIEFRVVAIEDLSSLAAIPAFDGFFSSFSGLNCVENIGNVRRNLARLLKPGALLVVSVMGRFVPWEVLWFVLHGDLGRATRRCRLSRSYPLDAGDLQIQVRSAGEMIRLFSPEFRLRARKGIGFAVPPSYMERWAIRFRKITCALAGVDRLLGSVPTLRSMADCAVLKFERTDAGSSNR